MNVARPQNRAEARALLASHFRGDASFDAFVVDKFPTVAARFGDGMDRVRKTNILLEQIDVVDLADALCEAAGNSKAETRARLFDAACKLLPAQFDGFVFKLGAPWDTLPGAGASGATRVAAFLSWAESAGRLTEVERLVTAHVPVIAPAPATAHDPRLALTLGWSTTATARVVVYGDEDVDDMAQELFKHTALLRRDKAVNMYWTSGNDSDAAQSRLNTANVLVLLVSPGLMGARHEDFLMVAERFADQKMLRVAVVRCRRTDWPNAPLGHLKAVPDPYGPLGKRGAKTMSDLTDSADDGWAYVAQVVRELVSTVGPGVKPSTVNAPAPATANTSNDVVLWGASDTTTHFDAICDALRAVPGGEKVFRWLGGNTPVAAKLVGGSAHHERSPRVAFILVSPKSLADTSVMEAFQTAKRNGTRIVPVWCVRAGFNGWSWLLGDGTPVPQPEESNRGWLADYNGRQYCEVVQRVVQDIRVLGGLPQPEMTGWATTHDALYSASIVVCGVAQAAPWESVLRTMFTAEEVRNYAPNNVRLAWACEAGLITTIGEVSTASAIVLVVTPQLFTGSIGVTLMRAVRDAHRRGVNVLPVWAMKSEVSQDEWLKPWTGTPREAPSMTTRAWLSEIKDETLLREHMSVVIVTVADLMREVANKATKTGGTPHIRT